MMSPFVMLIVLGIKETPSSPAILTVFSYELFVAYASLNAIPGEITKAKNIAIRTIPAFFVVFINDGI